MREFRPVANVIGRLTAVLGASMLLPAGLDAVDGNPNWRAFAMSAVVTVAIGAGTAVATRQGGVRGLTRAQAFLLTTLLWVVLPLFGALPFILGAPGVGAAKAYFEAMSGMTTTGASAFTGLETHPRGVLLWRALLQWYGGVGIVVVAMVFLPAMRVGGMQFFKSEAFDLGPGAMPRAVEIASDLSLVYVGLSLAIMIGYSAAGMSPFDALCHAMTTVSTGGLANYDQGFGVFSPAAHWVAIFGMIASAVPFIRFVQLARGYPRPIWEDVQIRGFLWVIAVAGGVMTAWLLAGIDHELEPALRHAFFNVVSIMTGTGYASDDYNQWGGLPMAVMFIVALIGGCTGSTSCSAKIFRYQILIAALRVQIRRIGTPHGVFPMRYQGRPVEPEIVSSVMAFFFAFAVCLSGLAILLSLMGLDTLSATSGSVAILTNSGPGLGPIIGPAGNYSTLPDPVLWVMSLGMLLGRLEFLSVLVLLTPAFWRR